MAKIGNVKMTVEIEPVVKIICFSPDCKNQIFNMPTGEHKDENAGYYCNLKHIIIGGDGECCSYEKETP